MNFNIIKEKDYLLLHRKEYELEVGFPKEKTPSNEIIKKEAAAFLKAAPELIVVKKIAQIYGDKKARADIYVYHDSKVLKEVEEIKKKAKKKKEGEAQQAEAPKKEEKKAKEEKK